MTLACHFVALRQQGPSLVPPAGGLAPLKRGSGEAGGD